MSTITNKIALMAALNSDVVFSYEDEKNSYSDEEIRNKLNEMLVKLTERKLSKRELETQEENKAYKQAILEWFSANNTPCTAAELAENVPELKACSTQKISSLMRQLFLAGRIDKESVKGKNYYKMK